MASLQTDSAVLVMGVLASDREHLAPVLPQLKDRFGPICMVSPWMPFTDTPYYEEEMGGRVSRRALVFARPVRQDQLAEIKRWTNDLERSFANGGRRTVNLDPGLLVASRFVLATTKDFTHRICLEDGLYADLTLIYKDGAFRVLPWTYPDYASGPMHNFLMDVRRRFVTHGMGPLA